MTAIPSNETCTSVSMYEAPASIASAKARSVFSGAASASPRCANIRGLELLKNAVPMVMYFDRLGARQDYAIGGVVPPVGGVVPASEEPNPVVMLLIASVNSDGIIHSLLLSPSAIFGSICKYW